MPALSTAGVLRNFTAEDFEAFFGSGSTGSTGPTGGLRSGEEQQATGPDGPSGETEPAE